MSLTDRILRICDEGLNAAPAYEPHPRAILTTTSGAALEYDSTDDGRHIRFPFPRGVWHIRETLRFTPETTFVRVFSATTGRPVVIGRADRVPAKRLRTNR